MINLQGKSPKLLVIGDLMIDHYLWGSTERISPESPVPVVDINREYSLLGGAGNVINNLVSLGAKVDVLSVIGDCHNSNHLRQMLTEIDIDTKYLVIEEGRLASKKCRIISAHQQVVRFDLESTNEINIESQNIILENYKKIVNNYEGILISDYGKGLLTPNLTQSLIDIANKYNKKIIVDPKGSDYSKYKGAYLLTPNIKEASEASKINIVDDESLNKAIMQLKFEYSLSISIITLSERGVAVYDDNFRIHPTDVKEVFDVTGAGDTVLASLGFSLACDLDIDTSIKFSNLAAGVVVSKIGSATATFDEINDYASGLKGTNSEKNIKILSEIITITSNLKLSGKKIIFTNGCFDLIHSGHIKYLEEAKKIGDILIVGLNSDASIKKLKGAGRPINSQNDRAFILAAIGVVDYVVVFDETTPYEIINALKPNFLVKGGDYKGKQIVGQDIVDEVRLIDFIDGKSTSHIIKKIKEN
jgi:D-beta-D-heptose 7-phosphate kinase/D-beta-D-heptose 1-phosphate adenosyltransferase